MTNEQMLAALNPSNPDLSTLLTAATAWSEQMQRRGDLPPNMMLNLGNLNFASATEVTAIAARAEAARVEAENLRVEREERERIEREEQLAQQERDREQQANEAKATEAREAGTVGESDTITNDDVGSMPADVLGGEKHHSV